MLGFQQDSSVTSLELQAGKSLEWIAAVTSLVSAPCISDSDCTSLEDCDKSFLMVYNEVQHQQS